MIRFALNHIWQSTVFALVVALMVRALRNHSARARFWLWTLASLKFLVPFALLAALGSHLPSSAPPSVSDANSEALMRLAMPFASVDPVPTQFSRLNNPPAISSSEIWESRLLVLWLVGCVSLLGRRLFQSVRLVRIRHTAQPAVGALGQLPIPVLLIDSGIEPGVFGVFRPVLFLPADIADRISPAQLHAVVAHELVHVERHDNLWAALHAIVQSIFWFHPLVWWMGTRLVTEREQATDEAVLTQGADAEEYAATILAVCRYYACAPQAGAAGIAGADLRQRIAAIMRFASARHKAHIRVGLAALAVVAIVTPIILGHAWAQAVRESPKLTFEVASIHEWGPGQGPAGSFAAGIQLSSGRVRSQCANLHSIVFFAYQLTGSEPLEGLPKWGNASCGYPDSAETFAIEATMPANTTPAQAREMMQTLLAERFRFAAHWETRQLPVYALSTAQGSSRLKPSDPAQDPPRPPGSVGCPGDDPHCNIWCGGSATITTVASMLTRNLGRPVIDKTGLSGSFYFDVLKWAGDESAGSSLPSLPALLHDEFAWS